MIRSRHRSIASRLASIAVAVLILGFGVFVGAGPASATTDPAAHLLGRALGTLYSQSPAYALAKPAGTPGNFSWQLVNDSEVPQRYQFDLICQGPCGPYSADIYVGGVLQADPYTTPLINPGSSISLIVRMTAAVGTLQGWGLRQALVLSEDGSQELDFGAMQLNVPAKGGTLPNDIYVKQGSRPAVGGDTQQAAVISQAVKPVKTVTFAIKVQNNTAAPVDNTVRILPLTDPLCGGMALLVKTGYKNVTNAVLGAGYTFHLAAHKSRQFSAVAKYTAFTGVECRIVAWQVIGLNDTVDPTIELFAVNDGTGQ